MTTDTIIIGTPHPVIAITTKEQAIEAYGPPNWTRDGKPLNITAAIHLHLDSLQPVVMVKARGSEA